MPTAENVIVEFSEEAKVYRMNGGHEGLATLMENVLVVIEQLQAENARLSALLLQAEADFIKRGHVSIADYYTKARTGHVFVEGGD